MAEYYLGCIVCTDDLYHHGIKGQKWGIRRFQNPDGSLTEAGKARYSESEGTSSEEETQSTGSKLRTALSDSIARISAKRHEKYIKKHPEKMTDDELKEYTNRMAAEANYNQTMTRLRDSKPKSAAKEFVSKFLERSANKLADKAFQKWMDNVFEDDDETTDLDDVMRHPERYTDKQIEAASKRSEGLGKVTKYMTKENTTKFNPLADPRDNSRKNRRGNRYRTKNGYSGYKPTSRSKPDPRQTGEEKRSSIRPYKGSSK